MSKVIRVYCVGGCGVNIGQRVMAALDGVEGSGPEFRVSMIDTSAANVSKDMLHAFYHVQGDLDHPTDGSGMVRKTNYPAIMRSLPHILNTFQPGDFNIIIGSASGGSGSVISPLLSAKLLESNKPFVVLLVGSQGCLKEVTNTIDTIESFQGIATKHDKSIACHYFDNGASRRKDVDGLIEFLVMLWGFLHGDSIRALDSKDIENFLNHEKVTNYPAGLSQLQLMFKDEYAKEKAGVALATLLTLVDEDTEPSQMDVAYHVVGTADSQAFKSMKLSPSIRIGNFQGTFTNTIKDLRAKVERFKAEEAAALVNRMNIQGADENGMKL